MQCDKCIGSSALSLAQVPWVKCIVSSALSQVHFLPFSVKELPPCPLLPIPIIFSPPGPFRAIKKWCHHKGDESLQNDDQMMMRGSRGESKKYDSCLEFWTIWSWLSMTFYDEGEEGEGSKKWLLMTKGRRRSGLPLKRWHHFLMAPYHCAHKFWIYI